MTPTTKARLIAAVAFPLLLLHTAPAAAADKAAPPPAAAPAETRLPHISIVAIGKGTPVILIPGLSSPRAVWDAVAPDLARTHRVYLVQVNGFAGDSPGDNLQPGLLDGVVADLHAAMARDKVSGAAVIGHSMGGLVGMMWARAHPGDVGKLMIVDSLPFYGALFGPTATVAAVEPQGRAMRDALVASYGKPADPAMATATADRLAMTPAARAQVKGWAMAADPRVTGEAMYEDLTTDLRPALPAIATPITLIYPWSAAGPTKPAADALYRGAYAGAPHVTFVDVPEAGHFVMLDQPAAFRTALDTFLAQ